MIPNSMMLRLNSLTTKQRVDALVPLDFTFKQLEDLLCQRFSPPTYPSSTTVRGFYYRDDIPRQLTYNPDDTLSSLRIQPRAPLFCDLISSPPAWRPGGLNTILIVTHLQDPKEILDSSAVCEMIDGETLDTKAEEGDQRGSSDILASRYTLDLDTQKSISVRGKDFPVTFFFSRIFREEIGYSEVGGNRLIAVAVHAVLIESGFIYYDPVSKMKIEGFHLPNELFSSSQAPSLRYTLPVIIDENMETVVLKFQGFEKYLTIYGSLAKDGYGTYWARVDRNRVSFIMNLIWANLDLVKKNVQREVSEFWKTIKDNLVLPLLIDLSERAGLAPPPCFSILPSDLKLQILKGLSGNDIARAACVCSELRHLSSNEDLWKEKYEEEFGSGTTTTTTGKWKDRFAKSWEAKNRIRSADSRRSQMIRSMGFQGWGYRRNVAAELRSGSGSGSHVRFYPRQGIFVPYCNLGGPNL